MVICRVSGGDGIVEIENAKTGSDVINHFGLDHVAIRKGAVLEQSDLINPTDVIIILQDTNKKRKLRDMETHLKELTQLGTTAGGPLPTHAAPAIPDDHPLVVSMREMMDGNVSVDSCRKALYYGKMNFEEATTWLIENLETDSLKIPITEQELAVLFPPNNSDPEPMDLSNQLSYFLQQAVSSIGQQ